MSNTVVPKAKSGKIKKRAAGTRSFASWQHEGFGQSCPEPFFGARIGVITDCDEPQDTRELVLHGFALHGNQPLETSA